ncbi:hypothetical protein EVAR_56853_1 [Eumeta japonica]|uniref:Uncharacterized protein n=1 Tax=Eumeta variegata TaxID=151549 RepID=A0A4C1YZG7_EUMVA|nr:hypothetical protein EVAR_56853_1 [Eumeta japonica]
MASVPVLGHALSISSNSDRDQERVQDENRSRGGEWSTVPGVRQLHKLTAAAHRRRDGAKRGFRVRARGAGALPASRSLDLCYIFDFTGL